MNPELKRLRNDTYEHMAGIIHDKLGTAVEELKNFNKGCRVKPVPVFVDTVVGKVRAGYHFRVTIQGLGTFTIPKNTKRHVYDVI